MDQTAAYQVVLFDLDGTLTDPKIGITKSVQYALSKFNTVEDNLDNLERFIGPPLFESFQKYYSFNESEARAAVGFYREYFSEFGLYENVVYPGIHDLLADLESQARKLIVATSKPTPFANTILEHFSLSDYFSSIVGSNLDGTHASKTEIIGSILSDFPGSQKAHTAMVGDREHDVLGARNNGIDSIAVTYGYGSLTELQNASPTHCASSVEDLTRLLV
ncbi:MAG: HAD family hydrolase [Candidatus Poribacteria bacterium]|nr:HAD family hydrolase [Candidatus Poribacteria bacterium]